MHFLAQPLANNTQKQGDELCVVNNRQWPANELYVHFLRLSYLTIC